MLIADLQRRDGAKGTLLRLTLYPIGASKRKLQLIGLLGQTKSCGGINSQKAWHESLVPCPSSFRFVQKPRKLCPVLDSMTREKKGYSCIIALEEVLMTIWPSVHAS